MTSDDEPTTEASSSRASFSSIREEAPPPEEGARTTIDYINSVIDKLLQSPLVRRPIELDAGNGARPPDTEREILACLLGRRSTGNDFFKGDLPEGLKPRVGIEIPAELEGVPLRLTPELGSSTPTEFEYPAPDSKTSLPAAFPPLKASQALEGQTVSGGPLVRHDRSFTPPDPEMISVLLRRPLPPIPEAAVQEGPMDKGPRGRPTISPQESGVPLPTLQTSTDIDHECGVDSEADIHPAFRSRENNEPLRLFRGASAFLGAAPFNDRRQGVARRSSTHDVQPAPPALNRPVYDELGPPPRLHHYSRSTSDLASRNASDFPPRQTSLMYRAGLPDQPRPDSNALGIYLEDFFTYETIPNTPPPEISRTAHPTRIPRSTGSCDLTPAQYNRNVALIRDRPGAIDPSNSSRDRRLTHNEGVRQFNQERYQGVGPSRTPPIRPPPPVSHSADRANADLLPSQPDHWPYPWHEYPAPRHAYPRVPASPQEEVDAASAQADTNSVNHNVEITQLVQPSAIERIASVMGTPEPADVTQPPREIPPSVVRRRVSRDLMDDGERAMRRITGGVKRALRGIFGRDGNR